MKKSLLRTVLVIVMILIVVMGGLMNRSRTKENREVAELENYTSELKESTNENSFMIISVENESAHELARKYKMITDEKEIGNLINIINRATKYEAKTFFTTEGCPLAEIYNENGEKYSIIALDQLDDNGNIVNVIAKWDGQNDNNKELYKVDIKLAEHIEKLYNTSKSNTLTDKEVYIRVGGSCELIGEYNQEYIILDQNTMCFSTNLTDKVLEGTYRVDDNNFIEYKMLDETQDNELHNSLTFRFENINGEKSIVIANNQEDEMCYQKIH